MNLKRIARNSVDMVWNSLSKVGGCKLTRTWYGGLGSILMFHRVREKSDISLIDSKRTWEVTPEYLESAVRYLKREQYDLVPIGQVPQRLASPGKQRFACLTFDDGYADNFTLAYPLLKKFNVPFCVYVTTSFPDKTALLTEDILSKIICKQDQVTLSHSQGIVSATTKTLSEKNEAYGLLTSLLCSLDGESRRNALEEFCTRHGENAGTIREENCVSWDQLKEMSSDPLVTIGAHTVNHLPLATLDRQTALREMVESKRILEEKLQIPVDHLAYPYGHLESTGTREFELAKQAGFLTATTTNPGNLVKDHQSRLHALCRQNVDGKSMQTSALDRLLSGYHKARARQFHRIAIPQEEC